MKLRKFAATALVFCLAASFMLLPEAPPFANGANVTAYAAPVEKTYEDLTYIENSDGSVTVTGCTLRKLSELVIPNDINGMTVTTIGASAFSGNRFISKVTLPLQLADLGAQTFYECANLRSIKINSQDGYSVFDGRRRYYTENGVLYSVHYTGGSEKLTLECYPKAKLDKSFTLPQSVEYIREDAFFACYRLEEVKLNKGLVSIGANAFNDCASLKEVTFPDTVEEIHYTSFLNCYSAYKPIIVYCPPRSYAAVFFKDEIGADVVYLTTPFAPTIKDAILETNEYGTEYKVRLTWSAEEYADGYIVYRSGSVNGKKEKLNNGVPVEETTFYDTTAKPGVEYFYFVQSVWNVGPEIMAVDPPDYSSPVYLKVDLKKITGDIAAPYYNGKQSVNIDLYSGNTKIASLDDIEGSYSFCVNQEGVYKLRFSMENCTSREYEVTLTGNEVKQNAKLLYRGDIDGNGKVLPNDATLALLCAVEKEEKDAILSDDYIKKVADVTGDDKVGALDATIIMYLSKDPGLSGGGN